MQGLRRWLRGDHRALNMDVLEQVFVSSFLILEGKKGTINDTSRVRIAGEMVQACEGLRNLQTTYEGDTETMARLQLLIDLVRDRILEINGGLKCFSDNFLLPPAPST